MSQPLGPIPKSDIKMTLEYFKELEEKNQIVKNFDSPHGRDNLPVPNNGYVTIRFRANNPGNLN